MGLRTERIIIRIGYPPRLGGYPPEGVSYGMDTRRQWKGYLVGGVSRVLGTYYQLYPSFDQSVDGPIAE